MTKEEMIEQLENTILLIKQNGKDWWDERDIPVLEGAIKALQTEPCEDMGEVSDGYHTFNQLYHQRAVLFACIVNQNKEKAWKSFKHSDGKYCFDSNGEWFIVGVDTQQGSYTYHYAKEYWNMFECKELECGKEWDGHTEEDVTRLLSLPSIQSEQRIDCTCIDKLKAKYYSESEYGVPEFDANKVIQLSDAIEIIKDYCGAKMEEGE